MSKASEKFEQHATGMRKPPHVIEIFLQPGEFYFGDRNTRIRTILGSCVSVTMWHPQQLIGGMCHYMLPYRGTCKVNPQTHVLDGKYAEEAILMFFQEAVRNQTDPSQYVVKVFGGGNMFPHLKRKTSKCTSISKRSEIEACTDVSCKNAAVIHSLAKLYGFQISAEHTGGNGHRQVLFDIWSGHVWMRQAPVFKEAG